MPSPTQRLPYRIVQSRQNSRVKELRASFSPAALEKTGRIGVEGEHLLGEAIRSGTEIAAVFVREGSEPLLERLPVPGESEILVLPREIFATAVATENPQGIAALVVPPTFSIDDLRGRPSVRERPALILVAAGLQDPGNLGTLVRSAEAFGASGVLLLPGTVSLWNPKALRASSGSAFRLPVVTGAVDTLTLLRLRGTRTLAAVAKEGLPLGAADLTGAVALLIGNEGSGLSEELLAAADGRLTIPCPGPVESLNAAIAGSILLYEASRQRADAVQLSKRQQVGQHPKRVEVP